MRRSITTASAAALLALGISCTLTQGIGDYGESGDSECPPERKLCGLKCADKADWRTGCAGESCSPCTFANAVEDGIACGAGGECTFAACKPSFRDCNVNAADGCEVNLLEDPLNCGGCGQKCQAPEGSVATCTAGTCGFSNCDQGLGDCDKQPANGCETRVVDDPQNCGACGKTCPTPAHGQASCNGTTCGLMANSCDLGAQNCDDQSGNGCECYQPNALMQCGTNGLVDGGAPPGTLPDGGDAPLNGGGGACTFGRCKTGYADCNKNVEGCETSVTSDPLNCGACEHSCERGACVAGRCQPFVLAQSQAGPGQIFFDGSLVYWTNYGGSSVATGTVSRVRNDGDDLTTIVSGILNAWGVGQFGNDVFYTNASPATNEVARAPKGTNQTKTPLATVGARIRGLAIDNASNFLYVGVYDGTVGGIKQGIYRLERTATGLTSLGTPFAEDDRINTIVVDNDRVCWTSEGTATVVGNQLKVAPSTGKVRCAPKNAPAEVKEIAVGLARPRGLAVDGERIYWMNVGNEGTGRTGSIESAPKNAPTPTKTSLVGGLSDAREIAVDATHVYYTSYGDNTIERIPKTGIDPVTGKSEILASQADNPLLSRPISIALDSKYVYWSNFADNNQGNGSIMRVVKP